MFPQLPFLHVFRIGMMNKGFPVQFEIRDWWFCRVSSIDVDMFVDVVALAGKLHRSTQNVRDAFLNQ